MLHKIWLLLLLAVCASGVVHASPDSEFLAAREAYAKGRIDQFERHAARVPDHYLLAPYLSYWRLKSRTTAADEWVAYAQKLADSPLSERVWHDLARFYGKNEDWPGFRAAAAHVAKPDRELNCFQLRARLAQGDEKAVREGIDLYRVSQDLPAACDPLFTSMDAQGLLTPDIRLARLRLALAAGNLRLGRTILAGLPADTRPDPALLTLAQRDPDRLLDTVQDTAAAREIVLYALAQKAKNSPEQAAARWERNLAAYPEPIQQHGWGVIALAAAQVHSPQAVTWFLQARDQLSDTQRLWKVRTMLRAGRWLDIFQSIVTLPPAVQEEAVWRYWKARSLKAMNANLPANQAFARLSQEFHYYGLLANEELPVRLETRSAAYQPSAAEMALARQSAGLARALLLHKLDLNVDAVTEWDWALKSFDDPQLLAAAELARQAQWYDRAIITAEKTRETHSLDLRYLTPYRDLAEAYARRNGLDPAWVYGLMRQESRFVDAARSGVGAQGLMQIMPATAKWIARQMGLDRRAHARMNDPEANIRFGTYYLKRVLDSLQGSPVLATAGYNAGPGRARKWQAETPLEGAVYVESIPFAETREYVKKVLANAMFYSQRLGLPDNRLKDRLGTIPARATKAALAAAPDATTVP